jgi:hypothetical protein
MSRQTEDAILRKLALCYTSTDGRDLYLFFQVIQMLRAHFGDDCLKTYYGDRYEKVMKAYKTLGYHISKLGLYLGTIQRMDKPHFFEIVDYIENNSKYKTYSELFAKISINMHLLYEIFTILLNQSSKLKVYNIPSYYWLASGVIEPQLLYKIQQQLAQDKQIQGAIPKSPLNEDFFK